MLAEKYRPKSFDEIVGHKRVVETLRGFVAKKDIPNILFVGRAGTGKTAMAYALRYELGLGDASSFIELNASDETDATKPKPKTLNIRTRHISSVKTMEIAYAAGFIDGEGSLNLLITKGEGRYKGKVYPTFGISPYFAVSNKDRNVLEELKVFLNTGKIVQDKKTHVYSLWISRQAEIERVLTLLLPYLRTKQALAKVLLTYIDHRKDRHYYCKECYEHALAAYKLLKHHGHKGTKPMHFEEFKEWLKRRAPGDKRTSKRKYLAALSDGKWYTPKEIANKFGVQTGIVIRSLRTYVRLGIVEEGRLLKYPRRVCFRLSRRSASKRY